MIMALEARTLAVREAIERARAAQARWALTPVRERALRVGALAPLIAAHRADLAAAIGRPGRPRGATAVAELLPIADAARWLSGTAPRVLAARRLGRWRWWGPRAVIERVPHGVVLIIGPANYPLGLVAIQALQALVAGNAVVIKPAPGAGRAIDAFRRLLAEAGIDPALCAVLDEDVAAVDAALEAGVDRVILTGRGSTGRALLARLAPLLIPATLELSGCDHAVVLAGADLERTARALAFAIALNGGATCIAPRRILVEARALPALLPRLAVACAQTAPAPPDPAALRPMLAPLAAAIAAGAVRVAGDGGTAPAWRPTVLQGVPPGSPLRDGEHGLPLAVLDVVDDAAAAVAAVAACPLRLGAAVFGPPAQALHIARRLPVGLVTINDAVAPLGDPRLPLAPRGQSGFGVTRGAEGLLDLTAPRALAIAGRFAPHLRPHADAQGESVLDLAHGRWRARLSSFLRLLWGG